MSDKHWSTDTARKVTDHLESRGKSLGMDEMREVIATALRAAYNEGVEAAAKLLDAEGMKEPVDMYDCYPDAAQESAEMVRALKEPTP